MKRRITGSQIKTFFSRGFSPFFSFPAIFRAIDRQQPCPKASIFPTSILLNGLLPSGCLANGIAMLLLVTIGQTTSLPLIVLSIAMNGLGFGLFIPSVLNGRFSVSQESIKGFFSGETETTRLVGISHSDIVIIIPFSLIIGDTRVIPENVPNSCLKPGWQSCFTRLWHLLPRYLRSVHPHTVMPG